MICKMVGGDFGTLVEIVQDRLGKDSTYRLNSDRVRNEFGWVDRINLTEGLHETLSWVDRYLSDFENAPLEYTHQS